MKICRKNNNNKNVKNQKIHFERLVALHLFFSLAINREIGQETKKVALKTYIFFSFISGKFRWDVILGEHYF